MEVFKLVVSIKSSDVYLDAGEDLQDFQMGGVGGGGCKRYCLCSAHHKNEITYKHGPGIA